jgi:hypothetical protein
MEHSVPMHIEELLTLLEEIQAGDEVEIFDYIDDEEMNDE